MSAPVRRPRCAPLLALFALAFFTWAGVRATVMQAGMAVPAAASTCAGMAGMEGVAPPRPSAQAKSLQGKSLQGKSGACPWCVAGAHAPLDCVVLRPPPPVHAVAFAAYATPPASGPQGPPARRPSARDPPPLSA